jgi:cell fate regulator YaaT (PSP1 superfamily)
MLVQFFDWGKPESVTSSMSETGVGDKIVVQHKWGLFVGEVISNDDGGSVGSEVVGQVIRKATAQDLELALKNRQVESSLKQDIKKSARNAGLGMKIVEVRLSIDSGCVIVIFTADNRVDFRDLVKTLSADLGKSVRFQQVGSRDEAKKLGGLGICGRELCCGKFSRGLKSITTDMARVQKIAHRGSDRLSGLCGRLMCCLSYESEQYEELSKNMPERGDKVVYEGREVQVADTIILEQKLKIVLSDGTRKTVELKDVDFS